MAIEGELVLRVFMFSDERLLRNAQKVANSDFFLTEML
jgi:hypothetical protein